MFSTARTCLSDPVRTRERGVRHVRQKTYPPHTGPVRERSWDAVRGGGPAGDPGVCGQPYPGRPRFVRPRRDHLGRPVDGHGFRADLRHGQRRGRAGAVRLAALPGDGGGGIWTAAGADPGGGSRSRPAPEAPAHPVEDRQKPRRPRQGDVIRCEWPPAGSAAWREWRDTALPPDPRPPRTPLHPQPGRTG